MKREEELTVSVKPLEWGPHPVFSGDDLAVADIPNWGEHGQKYQVGRDADAPGYKAFLAPIYGSWYWTSAGHANLDEAKAAAQADYEARIRSALLPTPKPEPVGWETDAEWDLEMRCANLTENTPFAEVSKLINDLWQQYCLAAEPKPESEGAVLDKPAMVGGTIFRTGVKASVVIGAAQRLYEKYWESSLAALTAKQTDGRGE